jgi:hypothetical protein
MEIEGFTNYLIYEDGRVYSKYKNKFLKPIKKKTGYYQLTLYNNKKPTLFLLHRLLAKFFIPNPDNLPFIDHKDRNPDNNCLDNLRWVSHRDNQRNQSINSRNTTGFQGVSFIKKYNCFFAQYDVGTKERKRISKRFYKLEDAVKWREEMVRLHYNRPN